MSNYYKGKFEHILKSWEKNTDPKKQPMDDVITDFIKSEFNFEPEYFKTAEFQDFLDCMVTILHSQNHKKADAYIRKRDFKKIRNLLYCYSAGAKNAFISVKGYAMIYVNFYTKASDSLVKEKAKAKYPQFANELRSELDDIHQLAQKSISG